MTMDDRHYIGDQPQALGRGRRRSTSAVRVLRRRRRSRAGEPKLKPVEVERAGRRARQDTAAPAVPLRHGHAVLGARQGAIVTGVDFSEPADRAGTGARDRAGHRCALRRARTSTTCPRTSTGSSTSCSRRTACSCWLPDLARWARGRGALREAGRHVLHRRVPSDLVGLRRRPRTSMTCTCGTRTSATEEPIELRRRAATTPTATAPLANTHDVQFPYPSRRRRHGAHRRRLAHRVPARVSVQHATSSCRSRRACRTARVRLTKHDGCVPLLFSIRATKPA